LLCSPPTFINRKRSLEDPNADTDDEIDADPDADEDVEEPTPKRYATSLILVPCPECNIICQGQNECRLIVFFAAYSSFQHHVLEYAAPDV
jgi:hypothetical protein